MEAILRVSVEANPLPEISWEFEGTAILVSGEDGRFLQLPDGSLKLNVATLNDSGTWTVLADNGYGQVARKEVALEVTPSRMPVEV